MSKLILALYVVTTTLGLIAIKISTEAGLPITMVDHKVQLNVNAYTLSGVFLYGVSFLLYMYLISKNDLGYIIPVAAAFVYIFIFTASYFIFHETFTPTKIIGILLIVSGLVFLNINK